jgi:hypothetical protein
VCGAAGALDGLCGRGWRFINLILLGYGLPAVLAAALALLWQITDRTVFLTNRRNRSQSNRAWLRRHFSIA